ncbi:MAG: hypothetical protein KF716_21250 [Anaerolineae bacterium]|nr:hypothetical protein [Anaerolineae bacterium]
MKIEDFGARAECLDALKRSGFTNVEEVVEFLEMLGSPPASTISGRWIKYFPEIVQQLKVRGFWTQKLESYWPDV